MKTFFELSEELRSRATKLPWRNIYKNDDFKYPKIKAGNKIVIDTVEQCFDIDDAAYIVHCVNSHATLCGLLEKALIENQRLLNRVNAVTARRDAGHRGKEAQMTLNLTDIEKKDFNVKWMFANSVRCGKNHMQVRAIFEKFLQSGLQKLNVEFTCPEIEALKDKIKKYEEIIRKQSETLEWYSISENTECPNECAGVPKLAIETLAWVKGEMG